MAKPASTRCSFPPDAAGPARGRPWLRGCSSPSSSSRGGLTESSPRGAAARPHNQSGADHGHRSSNWRRACPWGDHMAANPRRVNGTKRDRLVNRVKREETHCHLCGQPVQTTLPHGRAASPEVDEIVPVSLGGDPLARSNVRLSHRWCNGHRQNKPVHLVQVSLHDSPPVFDKLGHLIRPGGTVQARALRPSASRRWFG